MRLVPVALALVVSAAMARPAAAQLQTLNFDDIPNVPNGTVYVPESYHGYTFGGAVAPAAFRGSAVG